MIGRWAPPWSGTRLCVAVVFVGTGPCHECFSAASFEPSSIVARLMLLLLMTALHTQIVVCKKN